MSNKLIIKYFEKCVFYAFIFLIFLQTRKIFYFWGGEFNEWTAVSLYATDILAFALFVFWIFGRVKYDTTKKCRIPETLHINKADILLSLFVFWSGIGVFFAENFYLGVYRWIKLAEMVFLFFYVKQFF